MDPRWLGIVVSGKKLVAVAADVPPTGPIVIQSDVTFSLQAGDVGKSYAVLYRRVFDYVNQNEIALVLVKGSAISRSGVKLAHLAAAELRGIAIAAAASVCEVKVISKAVASRTFGERKVDEYVNDNKFFQGSFSGADLRLGSREAAFLLLYSRAG